MSPSLFQSTLIILAALAVMGSDNALANKEMSPEDGSGEVFDAKKEASIQLVELNDTKEAVLKDLAKVPLANLVSLGSVREDGNVSAIVIQSPEAFTGQIPLEQVAAMQAQNAGKTDYLHLVGSVGEIAIAITDKVNIATDENPHLASLAQDFYDMMKDRGETCQVLIGKTGARTTLAWKESDKIVELPGAFEGAQVRNAIVADTLVTAKQGEADFAMLSSDQLEAFVNDQTDMIGYEFATATVNITDVSLAFNDRGNQFVITATDGTSVIATLTNNETATTVAFSDVINGGTPAILRVDKEAGGQLVTLDRSAGMLVFGTVDTAPDELQTALLAA